MLGRLATVLVAVELVLGAAALHASAQSALQFSVSKTQGLDPGGETVTVAGSGYPESEGIYVAFCVVPPPGGTPTPCGGGADLEGDSGGSAWISSHPPSYGEGLAQSYGPGGSFEVRIRVSAMLNAQIDCRQVQCAVVSRADHTHLADRHLDVIVPIFFAADQPGATTATTTQVTTTTTQVVTTTMPPAITTVKPVPQAPVATAPTVPSAVGTSGSTTTAASVSTSTVPATTRPSSTLPASASRPTVVAATVPPITIAPSTTVEVVTLSAEPIEPSGGAGTATWPLWTGSAVAVVGIGTGMLYPRLRKAKAA